MTPTRSKAAAPIAAAFAFLIAVAAPARAEGPDISDFTLDNGLEVVVIPDHRAPVVTHMIWYKVGAADEERGKSGIAHFFEHLMFKGTKAHPAGEFDKAVAEIGGEENAFTTHDYTAFYEEVAPSALKEMMSFEADRMRGLVLTDDVIGPERDVVIEERLSRVESNPGARLSEETEATLYDNHPYGIPVLGWLDEMKKLNRKDAVAFYDRYYAPNNAVVVVAGDVDPETVRADAEATYGKVARGPDLPPRVRPTEPEHHTARTVTLKDPRVSLPSFQQEWLVPSYGNGKPGEAEALDLMSEILGGGTRSRLYQALIVKAGIAASAGAFYNGTALDQTSFGVYGTPRGDATLDQVEAGVEAEIARLAKDGVSEDELEAAKKRFLRGMIFARDNQSGMARIYGSTLTTGGTVKDVEEWPDRIRAVTAGEIQDMAKKYLTESGSVASYLLPAGEKVQ